MSFIKKGLAQRALKKMGVPLEDLPAMMDAMQQYSEAETFIQKWNALAKMLILNKKAFENDGYVVEIGDLKVNDVQCKAILLREIPKEPKP